MLCEFVASIYFSFVLCFMLAIEDGISQRLALATMPACCHASCRDGRPSFWNHQPQQTSFCMLFTLVCFITIET